MANGQRAAYTGADNIMAAYEVNRGSSPYFSVWQGRELRFAYNENDLDKGFKQLEMLIAVIDQNEDSDLYTIKIHPKPEKGYISDKTTVIGSMPVRVVALPDGRVGSVSYGNDLPAPVYNMLKSLEQSMPTMIAKQTLFEERILALEKAPVDVKELDTFDRIGAILEKPGVMELIGPAFSALIGRFMPQPQPNLQVNGTPPEKNLPGKEVESPDLTTADSELSEADNELLDNHIYRLSQHCDVVKDLGLLANIAEQKPEMFKMLLMNLRSV